MRKIRNLFISFTVLALTLNSSAFAITTYTIDDNSNDELLTTVSCDGNEQATPFQGNFRSALGCLNDPNNPNTDIVIEFDENLIDSVSNKIEILQSNDYWEFLSPVTLNLEDNDIKFGVDYNNMQSGPNGVTAFIINDDLTLLEGTNGGSNVEFENFNGGMGDEAIIEIAGDNVVFNGGDVDFLFNSTNSVKPIKIEGQNGNDLTNINISDLNVNSEISTRPVVKLEYVDGVVLDDLNVVTGETILSIGEGVKDLTVQNSDLETTYSAMVFDLASTSTLNFNGNSNTGLVFDNVDFIKTANTASSTTGGNTGGAITTGGTPPPPTGGIYGCTDPNAFNYNSSATIDDGSCNYGSFATGGTTGGTGGAGDFFGGPTGGMSTTIGGSFVSGGFNTGLNNCSSGAGICFSDDLDQLSGDITISNSNFDQNYEYDLDINSEDSDSNASLNVNLTSNNFLNSVYIEGSNINAANVLNNQWGIDENGNNFDVGLDMGGYCSDGAFNNKSDCEQNNHIWSVVYTDCLNVDSLDAVIDNNIFSDCLEDAVVLGDSSFGFSDNNTAFPDLETFQFSNNKIGGGECSDPMSQYDNQLDCENNSYVWSSFNGPEGNGVVVNAPSVNGVIENSLIKDVGDDAIRLMEATSMTVSGVDIENPTMSGIVVNTTGYDTDSNNYSDSSGWSNLTIGGTSVSDKVVIQSPGQHGVFFNSSLGMQENNNVFSTQLCESDPTDPNYNAAKTCMSFSVDNLDVFDANLSSLYIEDLNLGNVSLNNLYSENSGQVAVLNMGNDGNFTVSNSLISGSQGYGIAISDRHNEINNVDVNSTTVVGTSAYNTCNDGIDNDGDTFVDENDNDSCYIYYCDDPQYNDSQANCVNNGYNWNSFYDASSQEDLSDYFYGSGTGLSIHLEDTCNDNLDNDGDGLIDLGDSSDCTSSFGYEGVPDLQTVNIDDNYFGVLSDGYSLIDANSIDTQNDGAGIDIDYGHTINILNNHIVNNLGDGIRIWEENGFINTLHLFGNIIGLIKSDTNADSTIDNNDYYNIKAPNQNGLFLNSPGLDLFKSFNNFVSGNDHFGYLINKISSDASVHMGDDLETTSVLESDCFGGTSNECSLNSVGNGALSGQYMGGGGLRIRSLGSVTQINNISVVENESDWGVKIDNAEQDSFTSNTTVLISASDNDFSNNLGGGVNLSLDCENCNGIDLDLDFTSNTVENNLGNDNSSFINPGAQFKLQGFVGLVDVVNNLFSNNEGAGLFVKPDALIDFNIGSTSNGNVSTNNVGAGIDITNQSDCADGIDNDNDGYIDFNSGTADLDCSDGNDNEGDGVINVINNDVTGNGSGVIFYDDTTSTPLLNYGGLAIYNVNKGNIYGNRINNNYGHGALMANSRDINFSNNYVGFDPITNSVAGNVVGSANYFGVDQAGGSGVFITSLYDNYGSYPYMGTVEDINIYDNTITSNDGAAITLYSMQSFSNGGFGGAAIQNGNIYSNDLGVVSFQYQGVDYNNVILDINGASTENGQTSPSTYSEIHVELDSGSSGVTNLDIGTFGANVINIGTHYSAISLEGVAAGAESSVISNYSTIETINQWDNENCSYMSSSNAGSLVPADLSSCSSGAVFSPSESDLSAGYVVSLELGDIVSFMVNGISHSVTLDSLSAVSASFTVASTPVNATVGVGVTEYFNLNNDSSYDLSVTVNSVDMSLSQANFTVASVDIPVAASTVPPSNDTTSNDTASNNTVNLGGDDTEGDSSEGDSSEGDSSGDDSDNTGEDGSGDDSSDTGEDDSGDDAGDTEEDDSEGDTGGDGSGDTVPVEQTQTNTEIYNQIINDANTFTQQVGLVNPLPINVQETVNESVSESEEDKSVETNTNEPVSNAVSAVRDIFSTDFTEQEKEEVLEESAKVVQQAFNELLSDDGEEFIFTWDLEESEELEKQYEDSDTTVVDPSTDLNGDGVPAIMVLESGEADLEKDLSFQAYVDYKLQIKPAQFLKRSGPSIVNLDKTTFGSSGLEARFVSAKPGEEINTYLIPKDEYEASEEGYESIYIGSTIVDKNNKAILNFVPKGLPDEVTTYYLLTQNELGDGDVKEVIWDPTMVYKDLELNFEVFKDGTSQLNSVVGENGDSIDFSTNVTGDEVQYSFADFTYTSTLLASSVVLADAGDEIDLSGYGDDGKDEEDDDENLEPGVDVLEGDTNSPGDYVFATWQSVTYNSVALADASQNGSFKMTIPKDLAPGKHTLRVYVFDPDLNIVSGISSLLFDT